MTDLVELMSELNPAQLQAVQHPPQIPLQILAGPGSGKTKVLTMRIAYLISNCYLPPWSLCAVTFTNKAANEMRERLVKLIGKDKTAQVKMGTFHALCAMFLRKYSRVVGLEGNFTVCDADESKKILSKLLKAYKEELSNKNITLKENGILGIISKAKAKGWSADDAAKHVEEMDALTPQQLAARLRDQKEKGDLWYGELGRFSASIYKQYEKTLRDANSLDFDDLLLFGVKLFAKHAKASSWCRHVLVDEYQDTNIMQYELMTHIARASQCVTIVGDPDQSIYGWRSAEVENLAKMQRDFPASQQIYLEQNYRSTASILALSVAVISQDKARIQKTLHASHSRGPTPVFRVFPIEQVESAFVAAEIKRLVAYSGGMLNWGDFVVLLRYNSLSRGIESALQKEGIPNRVLAGQKFFERMEIKDILAYLQLVDNPKFVPAFLRVVNIPSRAVGEKTIHEIILRAEQLKVTPMAVVERIVDGKIPDIKPPIKRKLAPFVETIHILRKHANNGIAPSKLINALAEEINYKEHLLKVHGPDCDSRWDNVQELVNFASEVERSIPAEVAKRMANAEEALHNSQSEDEEESEEEWADELDEFDADQVQGGQTRPARQDTPLRLFLQASMLSTDTETPEEEKSKEKVTISTCHAAKGLEWPVVMIPAVEGGVFPSSRSEDTEEERRLLYVACTRAQGLLYLSHAASRMFSGEYKPQYISPFVGAVRSEEKTKGLLSATLPSLPVQDLKTIATVTGRALPDEAEVTRRVAEYTKTAKHPAWGENAPFRDASTVSEGGYGVLGHAQQFPSILYAGTASSNQHNVVQPPPGPVAFSSGSSLLTPAQRAGVIHTAVPLASSNSRVVNTARKSVPPQPKSAVKPPSSESARAATRIQWQSKYAAAWSSSAGTSIDDPIDIDALDSKPTTIKPSLTRPSLTPSARPFPPGGSSQPSRRALTQVKQELPPAPPPSLSYRTQPSSGPSLPSSTSPSSSVASPSPVAPPSIAEPAVKPAPAKRQLGMGRTAVGYANKKFKPLRPGA